MTKKVIILDGQVYMIKNKSTISINVLLVLVILISLFMGIVSPANAWFKANHADGVQIIVNIGDVKLKLYQIKGENSELVNSNDENSSPNTTEKKYIDLDGPIAPDIPVELNLRLDNQEEGSAGMYVKFKFEIFVRGVDRDQSIPVTVTGVDSWSETNAGFKYNAEDKYYYYCDEEGNNKKFEYGVDSSLMLMNSFTIKTEDMFDQNGNAKFVLSESIYIKLNVKAGISDFQ